MKNPVQNGDYIDFTAGATITGGTADTEHPRPVATGTPGAAAPAGFAVAAIGSR